MRVSKRAALAGFVLIIAGTSAFQMSGAADKSALESITVKVVGMLRSGIVAIGGETTGATVTAKGITWELDFGKKSELRKKAGELGGGMVVVMGSLERKRGVEIRERWIVKVDDLRSASENRK